MIGSYRTSGNASPHIVALDRGRVLSRVAFAAIVLTALHLADKIIAGLVAWHLGVSS